MATKGTRLLNSILGLEDEEENVNVGGGEQQGVYSNVPRVQAKHNGFNVGNMSHDHTKEDDGEAGKGTVLEDDGRYVSPYETKEGIKQVEEGTRQQEDDTDPFKQRVGVVPDDIANHDFNKGMENDVVDDKPATTTPTGNEQVYNSLDDIYKELISKAEEGEKETQANEAELKRTAKRRMLLAGIADAANSFHQAYAYARGIKAMNDNKGYAKEMRKELREDLDWLRKNKDRVLNYRAKAAEIQKTIAALKNQEDMMNWRYAEQARKEKKQLWDMQREQGKLDIEKERLKIQRDLADGRISKIQHDILMDELEYQDKLQRTAIAQQNADLKGKKKVEYIERNDLGEVVRRWYEYVDEAPSDNSSGNSSAGNSGNAGNNTGKKQLPTAKKPLPQS